MDLQTKLTILNAISEKKHVLFGKFSDKLTHSDKINQWKGIARVLNDTAIMNKDWKYLRDTMWQNWKRRTMEKRDNQFKTGSGGGKKMKLDASDELILSIIGKESPVIHGLDSAESSGSNAQQPMELFSEETDGSTLPVPASPQPSQQAVVPMPIRRKFCTRNKGSLEVDAVSNEILQLKKKKVELEIGKLERETYKLDLELLKLEKELNITRPSKFTLPLYLQDDAIIHINLVNGPSEILTDSTESNITSE